MMPFSGQGIGKGVSNMPNQTQYKYLDRWPGSKFRQFFYTERKIRAETLYRATAGPEARTAEEVAEDYDVPLEVVYEAIDYCIQNEDLLRQELEEGLAEMRARGLDKPSHFPAGHLPDA
jgi:uncharacterized protein (DUF433 family)